MWQYLLAFVLLAFVTNALAPRRSQPTMTPGTFDLPTAEDGRPIPVLFGTRRIKGPNVVWYGDLRTVAIRKKGGKK